MKLNVYTYPRDVKRLYPILPEGGIPMLYPCPSLMLDPLRYYRRRRPSSILSHTCSNGSHSLHSVISLDLHDLPPRRFRRQLGLHVRSRDGSGI